jgi:excisionase family DNA binding protein
LNPPKRFSPFDYTVTVSRRQRHLVVTSPEFGFTVSSGRLDLGEPDSGRIGEAVLRVIQGISQKLQDLDREGREAPDPRPVRELLRADVVSAQEAARILGVSRKVLRRLVYLGHVRSERTPGGHLRFTLEGLAEYLSREEENQPA